jgi:hypothetical protein
MQRLLLADAPIAEELNRISLRNPSSIPVERKYYGYPSCFTAWNASSVPANASAPAFTFETGAQFSRRLPPTMPDDAWCANPQNNIKPVLSMQAHSAPLDLVFYDSSKSARSGPYSIPRKWDGDAFVSFHGSWNRDPPTGEYITLMLGDEFIYGSVRLQGCSYPMGAQCPSCAIQLGQWIRNGCGRSGRDSMSREVHPSCGPRI